ncbi:unnamed protein product [Mycena citricolor]|uniref:J domain-containing protein n=1 Tax=Mycena citricolor TaxID=2018698 RepID=A0AAD2K6H3_9AGAR|nr:unnamed protein product [Mycena citricolor]CAK5281889.1 unnamed protein product [Mycena citricolor]
MAIPFLGVLGWAFVPHHATQQAVKILHYVLLRFFQITPPRAGTLEYQRDYRYTFAVVVLGYLIYTLIQGSNAMLPNYYEMLGVYPNADEGSLKLAFRQFAKRYHPDRVGPQGEALFIQVRDAFEALKNPTVRFAYDRFGPAVLGWTHCSTTGEYLRQGLTQSLGYHVVAGAVLVFWTAIGETSPVAFWRYLLCFSLFVSELSLIVSPSPSLVPSGLLLGDPTEGPSNRTLLHLLFPRRVAYQHILFLHQLFLFMSIALSRVAPQFLPDPNKVTEAMTHRLLHLVTNVDCEASQLLHSELHVIQPSAEQITLNQLRPVTNPSADVIMSLTNEMENMLIESAVKQEVGPLKSVWQNAIASGRRLATTTAAALPQTPRRLFEWPLGGRFGSGSPVKRNAGNGGSPSDRQGRMSPPPSIPDRPNYTRARSISLL